MWDRSGRRAWRFGLLVLALSTVRVANEGVAVAQSPPTETVHLLPNGAAITESGLLDSRAHDDHGYVFRGEAGQVLEVELRASHRDVSFEVAPLGAGPALVNSAISGEKHWSGKLPSAGEYRVRVFLQRSAARRVVTGRYFLSLELRATTPPPASELGGSTWQLVRVRSADDRTLVLRAGQREKYTLTFGSDGRIAVRADCHRVFGNWMSAGENQLTVTALSASRARCESGTFSNRFLRDLSYVRSYSLRGGRLYLSLLAGGGTYEFEPVAVAPLEGVKPSFDSGEASGKRSFSARR